MGLAKVLLGRGNKDAGLSKCVRVDSLGLAKRRLAAKAAHEDSVVDVPDLEEPLTDGNDGVVLAASQGPLEQGQRDDVDAVLANLMKREHRDSLRIHRRRFRQRASLDISSPRFQNAFPDKVASWSSCASPTAPDGRDEPDHEGDDAEAAGCSAPSHQVRFRRASDGEYLARQSHKSFESSLPNALKAVQMKAERLFRRLTANFAEPLPRPRSAAPSRGGSPTRSQRNSTSRAASTARSSASWAFGLRYRAVDAGVDAGVDADVSTSPRLRTTVDGMEPSTCGGGGGGGLRAKRQSAPGELFFAIIGGGSSGCPEPEPVSPTTCPTVVKEAAGAVASSLPGPAAGASKGRNWLARLSRGLNVGTAAKPHPAQATTPTSPAPAPVGDSGRSPVRGTSAAAAGSAVPTAIPTVTATDVSVVE